MNWQKIHSIMTQMASQQTIPNLNAAGLSAIRTLLGDSSYRIMINRTLKNDAPLHQIYLNTEHQFSDQEQDLITKLGASAWGYEHMFELDSFYCFVVSSQANCFVLTTVAKDASCADKPILEILKTIVTVWSKTLDTLYHYQRDYLTGLLERNILMDAINGNFYNSALFSENISEKPALERRYDDHIDESHAVALIDIDDFHSVNDRWGHSIGDEVLIKMASLMELSFRDRDVICRYNGEKFAVFLRSIESDQAEASLQRFCERVADSTFPKADGVTVTIGYTMTRPGMLASELLDRADKALLQGKMTGKNQVVAAQDIVPFATRESSIDIGEIDLF